MILKISMSKRAQLATLLCQKKRHGTMFNELELTRDEHLERACFVLSCSLRGKLIERRTAAGLVAHCEQDLLFWSGCSIACQEFQLQWSPPTGPTIRLISETKTQASA